MKILQNNYIKYNTNTPVEWTCPECKSVIQLDPEESHRLTFTCPCCGKTSALIKSINLNGTYNSDGTMYFHDSIRVEECEHCERSFNVLEGDLIYKELGLPYAKCPHCGKDTSIGDENDKYSLVLTEDNIQFPQHFSRFSRECNSVPISDEETLGWIKECIKHLKRHPEDDSWGIGSGDTRVFVFNNDEDKEYEINVCKDFYESYIPYD